MTDEDNIFVAGPGCNCRTYSKKTVRTFNNVHKDTIIMIIKSTGKEIK